MLECAAIEKEKSIGNGSCCQFYPPLGSRLVQYSLDTCTCTSTQRYSPSQISLFGDAGGGKTSTRFSCPNGER